MLKIKQSPVVTTSWSMVVSSLIVEQLTRGRALTVTVLLHASAPSSEPLFGVTQACQASLTEVSCETTKSVLLLYKATICSSDRL